LTELGPVGSADALRDVVTNALSDESLNETTGSSHA